MSIVKPKVGDLCLYRPSAFRGSRAASGRHAKVTAVQRTWLTFCTDDGRNGWARLHEDAPMADAWIGEARPSKADVRFNCDGILYFDVAEAKREIAYGKLRSLIADTPSWAIPSWLTTDKIEQAIELLTFPKNPAAKEKSHAD